MRILLTVVSLDSEKGAGVTERNRWLARHLAEQGHQCEVMTIEGGDHVQELRDLGITVSVTSSIRLGFDVPLVSPWTLVSSVRRADAVHLTGYWNLLNVLVALVAFLLRTPYVLSPAGEVTSMEELRPASRVFHFLLGRQVVRGAALLVGITPLERDEIRRRFGLPAERVVVVPNGVARIEAAEPRVALPDAPFVLFMGRLAQLKGPDLLIRAFAEVASEHPEVQLVIAGPDSGMGVELRALVGGLGLRDRVQFTGHLGESDRTAGYHRALFLAIPSRSEAMSLVALEAGVTGTPVLLTDRCGFDSVAQVGGGLVVAASVEGLASGLRRMLQARDSLPSWGENLRRHVQDDYGWPSVVVGLVSHLRTITSQLPARGKSE